jgi:hypothetical protein
MNQTATVGGRALMVVTDAEPVFAAEDAPVSAKFGELVTPVVECVPLESVDAAVFPVSAVLGPSVIVGLLTPPVC